MIYLNLLQFYLKTPQFLCNLYLCNICQMMNTFLVTWFYCSIFYLLFLYINPFFGLSATPSLISSVWAWLILQIRKFKSCQVFVSSQKSMRQVFLYLYLLDLLIQVIYQYLYHLFHQLVLPLILEILP